MIETRPIGHTHRCILITITRTQQGKFTIELMGEMHKDRTSITAQQLQRALNQHKVLPKLLSK